MKEQRVKTGLFCAGVLFFVLVCMALPTVFCALQQSRLLQTIHLRPAAENALSPQGRENPLAKLLYDRQYLAGTTPEWDSTGWQALEQTQEEQTNIIQAAAERLLEGGLFSETQAEALNELLTGQLVIRRTALRDEADFTRYEWDTDTDSLLLELGPDGEPVQVQWSGGDSQTGAEQLLEYYLSFLGINGFTDWQDLSVENGHLAAVYSPTAQLYVYARTGSGMELGAEHKTPEQIAQATGG